MCIIILIPQCGRQLLLGDTLCRLSQSSPFPEYKFCIASRNLSQDQKNYIIFVNNEIRRRPNSEIWLTETNIICRKYI